MAKPYIVRPELTEDDVISEIRAGNVKVSDLEKRSEFKRGKIRGLIEKHAPKNPINLPSRKELNPVTVALPAVKPPAPVKPKPAPSNILQKLIGYGCALIALAFGAVGMVMNYRFAHSFGQDEFSSLVLGVLGLAIDGAALLLLPAAGALGEQRRYGQCILACLIWIPFVALSTVAAMGFAGANIGDAMQARGSVSEQRTALTEQKTRAESDRKAIKETGNPQVLENQMITALGSVPTKNRESSNQCATATLSAAYCADYQRLKDAYIAAKARVGLDDKIASLTSQIAAVPQIAAKDPAADQIEQMTFGLIAAEQVGNYRVRGLAIVPGFASILLAFARALLR